MFNFIYDGKLGDILAPVVPTNKLFLAIQHHKNDEVHQLIMINNDLKENGYGAIHVACRYNNRYALELILSKDVKIETKDQKGNTPLHYASKYGHIDLCKYLVEKGSSTIMKNNNQETPYDVTENHIVRQYLLPLQLSAERVSLGDSNIPGMDPITMSALGYTTSAPVYNNHSVNSYPVVGVKTSKHNEESNYSAIIPNSHVTYNAPHTSVSNPPPSIVTPLQSTLQPNQGPYQIPRQTTSSTRVIQPDGFHSSASDPVLQKRYGHVYETKNIAPPPTALMYNTSAIENTANVGGYVGTYSMYSASPGQSVPRGVAPNPIYNRYVPYDVHNNTTHTTTSASAIPPSHNHPPMMIHQTQKKTLPNSLYTANSNSSLTNTTPIELVPINATPSSQNNKLLGNKSVVSGIDLLQSDTSIAPPVTAVIGSSSISTTMVMNNHSTNTSFHPAANTPYNNVIKNTNNSTIHTNSITVTTTTLNESSYPNFDLLNEHEVITANSFLCGSDLKEEYSLKTPEKKPATLFSGPTPGEVVSKLQSEVLKRDRFASVFGEENVKSWGFDWDALENPDASFADSYRISTMSKLHEKLTKAARTRFDEPFSDLYAKFLTLRDRIAIVHAVRLETVTERYFNAIFPDSIVENDVKSGGVQLGTKAKVTLATGEERVYHIKTHSEGRLSSKSSAAKLVNPQELLIYKILQYTGFGCETHFLQRSPEDVYIATLDAGHGGSFEMFVKAAGRLGKGGDEVYGQSLWGTLQDIHTDPAQNDWKAVEISIQGDAIAQNFLIQVSALDMLSRILRLHDLLNNTENFGFLSKEGENPALKVIDFRVADEGDFIVDNERFGGFLAGNGWYNYASSHRATRYGLHDRLREERVASALRVLTQGSLAQLHQHVELAYRDIHAYITETDIFVDNSAELMGKLNVFHDALHHNIEFFIGKLRSWEPELV